MTQRSSDELAAEGKKLSRAGHLVVFLYPSQEWMAVETQTPFLRYGRLDEQTAQEPDDPCHGPQDTCCASCGLGFHP